MNKIIVCLVSRQAMANVIPVLELKPDKVILLITEEEKGVAVNIKKVFEQHSILTEIYSQKIDAYNLELMKNVCMDVIRKNYGDIILNITGGTKPMAVAAYEIFKSADKKVIYHDPLHHRIISLNPLNQIPANVNLKINVEDYLLSYGYRIIEDKTKSGRAEEKMMFFNYFNIKRYTEFVEFYNLVKEKCPLDSPHVSKDLNGFQFSKNIGKITIIDKRKNNSLRYDLSNFNLGDILEDMLFLLLKKTRNDDIRYAVKISKGKIKSEIDLLLTKDCNLYLYSCKDKKKKSKFDLFEIEVLRSITGGTFGKANLVVTKTDDFLEQFAKQLNINLINIKDIYKNI